MQFAKAALVSLLAAFAAAAPTADRTTVQLSNDQSGANANVVIPLDGVTRYVTDLWRGTAVDRAGAIVATSAQLAQVVNGAACVFAFNGAVFATLNDRRTFVDVDGNPANAVPVVLNGATLQCQI